MHLSGSLIPGIFRVSLHSLAVSLVITLIILVLAKPERKLVPSIPDYGGIRISFLYDVSLSMRYAEDLGPNRLVVSKKVVEDFIRMTLRDPELKGFYKFAMIPFAGGAYPFFAPFTSSADEFLAVLQEVDEKTVRVPGTSLYAALRAYDELLFRYRAEDPNTVDLAILISDGGKEEQNAEEVFRLKRIIKFLREDNQNLIINTVGIGRVSVGGRGERVSEPVELVIRDGAGNFVDFYRENPNEPPYTSRLDEKVLEDIAGLGGGKYYHFADGKKMAANFKEIVLRHRKLGGYISKTSYESVRNWFLLPAFAMLYFLFGYHGWIFVLLSRFKKLK